MELQEAGKKECDKGECTKMAGYHVQLKIASCIWYLLFCKNCIYAPVCVCVCVIGDTNQLYYGLLYVNPIMVIATLSNLYIHI